MKCIKSDPIRTVDTAALDRAIGKPGYIRLWQMIRDRIAASDAAESDDAEAA